MPSAVTAEEFVAVISLHHQSEEAAGNSPHWLRCRPALGCAGPVTRGTSRHPLRSARNQQQTCVIAPTALAMPRGAPTERKQPPGATMTAPLALLRRAPPPPHAVPSTMRTIAPLVLLTPRLGPTNQRQHTRATMIVPLALLRRAPPQGATHSVQNEKKRTRTQLCDTMRERPAEATTMRTNLCNATWSDASDSARRADQPSCINNIVSTYLRRFQCAGTESWLSSAPVLSWLLSASG